MSVVDGATAVTAEEVVAVTAPSTYDDGGFLLAVRRLVVSLIGLRFVMHS